MIDDRSGNVVVLAGNNGKKTGYVEAAVEAGINVLSDKPMAIDGKRFAQRGAARWSKAGRRRVLVYDIMTERSEINNELQRVLVGIPSLFGQMEKGTPEDPAITKESVHHFFKYVSGQPLTRPEWYFDIEQQGEGIVDVTTHLSIWCSAPCCPSSRSTTRHRWNSPRPDAGRRRFRSTSIV